MAHGKKSTMCHVCVKFIEEHRFLLVQVTYVLLENSFHLRTLYQWHICKCLLTYSPM